MSALGSSLALLVLSESHVVGRDATPWGRRGKAGRAPHVPQAHETPPEPIRAAANQALQRS